VLPWFYLTTVADLVELKIYVVPRMLLRRESGGFQYLSPASLPKVQAAEAAEEESETEAGASISGSAEAEVAR
jgi:hypothetical protein